MPKRLKNEIRLAMLEENRRQRIPAHNLPDNEFDWMIAYLEKMYIKKTRDVKRIREHVDNFKTEMRKLTIDQFGYNIDRLYDAFVKKWERIITLGETLPEEDITRYFQEACAAHGHLTDAAVDPKLREDKSFHAVYSEMTLILEAKERIVGKFVPPVKPKGNDGNGVGKSHATKFRGKCNGCGKPGHKLADCWHEHPEKKPQWLKEKEAQKHEEANGRANATQGAEDNDDQSNGGRSYGTKNGTRE